MSGKEPTGFSELPLSQKMLESVQELGLKKPTRVQAVCIPKILKGENCLAHSPTGSGKTMAFAIPMIQKWSIDPFGVYGLILTPTRELAHQIKEQFELLGGASLKVSIIIGGIDMQTQALDLQKRPHFVVATPGRLADHIDTGGQVVVNLFKNLKFLVLDEADRILDGQFDEQLKQIMLAIPKRNQVLLFSATMTDKLLLMGNVFANQKLSVDDFYNEDTEKPMLEGRTLTQKYILCPPDFKDGYLIELLRSIRDEEFSEKIRSMIIFVSTCRDCRVMSVLLTEMGFPNVVLHSQMDQKERITSLVKFKSSCVQTLIATDVVSRGLDITIVDLVINYSVPMPTDYVHRVGRTGRAGRKGFSIALITPRDIPFLDNVEKYIGQKLTELVIDEGKVLQILTDVNTSKREADLTIEEDDPFAERKRINERKRMIMNGIDPSDSEEEESITKSNKNKISKVSKKAGNRNTKSKKQKQR